MSQRPKSALEGLRQSQAVTAQVSELQRERAARSKFVTALRAQLTRMLMRATKGGS